MLFVTSAFANEKVLWGEPLNTTKGKIRTFIKVNMRDGSDQIGVAMSNSLVTALHEHEAREFILPLPSTHAIRPFNHVVINWVRDGHTPNEIYGAPHFDIHFYFIPESIRQKMTCTGSDAAICHKQPALNMIPPFYVSTPQGEPKMGWHWVDPRSPEFNGQPFTATLIYGFYNGKINFIEPMVTRDFLLSKQSFVSSVSVPEFYSKNRIFPRSYSVSFNEKDQMHYIVLHKKPAAIPEMAP